MIKGCLMVIHSLIKMLSLRALQTMAWSHGSPKHEPCPYIPKARCYYSYSLVNHHTALSKDNVQMLQETASIFFGSLRGSKLLIILTFCSCCRLITKAWSPRVNILCIQKIVGRRLNSHFRFHQDQLTSVPVVTLMEKFHFICRAHREAVHLPEVSLEDEVLKTSYPYMMRATLFWIQALLLQQIVQWFPRMPA